jgi:peptidoglycan/LPS O-acetylase OafA/YrhL
VYLLHMLVREMLLRFVPPDLPLIAASVLPMELAFTGLGLVLSLGLAYVSWHVLERPMLRLKARVVYGQAVPPTRLAAFFPPAFPTWETQGDTRTSCDCLVEKGPSSRPLSSVR